MMLNLPCVAKTEIYQKRNKKSKETKK